MNNVNIIVDYYLTTKDNYLQEKILKNLLNITCKDNFLEILNKLENHKNFKEIDTGIYLIELSKRRINGLTSLVKKRLLKYKGKNSLRFIYKNKIA